jgi:hypothetical protein
VERTSVNTSSCARDTSWLATSSLGMWPSFLRNRMCSGWVGGVMWKQTGQLLRAGKLASWQSGLAACVTVALLSLAVSSSPGSLLLPAQQNKPSPVAQLVG